MTLLGLILLARAQEQYESVTSKQIRTETCKFCEKKPASKGSLQCVVCRLERRRERVRESRRRNK